MGFKKLYQKFLLLPILGLLFAIFTNVPLIQPAYAVPNNDTETTQTNDSTEPGNDHTSSEESSDSSEDEKSPSCYQVVGNLSWIVCPVTTAASGVVDGLYSIINNFLVIEPITFNEDASIYIVWSYARSITNILFIIFILVAIFSQLTGAGFSNYNIKKILPRIIIAAVLVNLSFIICSLAVDASNVIGASTRGFFDSITETVKASSANLIGDISWKQIVGQIFGTVGATAGTAGVAALAIGAAGGIQKVMILLIPVVLGAVASLIIGIFTIALRQVVVALLVMISPLAFVAYLLPNTEKYFQKWLNLLKQMLFFYPVFSALYGASELIGWTFITNGANRGNALEVIIGMAMQVFPLIFSFKLLKMSDTVLGKVNDGLHKLTQPAMNRINDLASRRAKLAAADHDLKYHYQPRRFNTNPYRAGSRLRNFVNQKNAELNANLAMAEQDNQSTVNKYVSARKLNKDLVYNEETGQLEFSKKTHTDGMNTTMQRAVRNKDISLRNMADESLVNNRLSQLSAYQAETGLKDKNLDRARARLANSYLDLETEATAKRRNDLADKRFYASQVLEASKTDEDGNIIDKKAYNRLVKGAAGADAFATGEHADQVKNNANIAAISGAYDFNEAERQNEIKRFSTFLGTQSTHLIEDQIKQAISNDDTNSLIAGLQMLHVRGDDDLVQKYTSQFMNEGRLKLGTEDANNFALCLMQMKETPVLRRVGKFINVETRAFTDGNRGKAEDLAAAATITYDEFVTGKTNIQYRDSDGNLVSYQPKYDIVSTLTGTAHKQLDRTSMQALIQSEYETAFPSEEIRHQRIAEINDQIRPQLISAIPGYDSGSEPLIAAIGYITGQKMKNGKWVLDTSRVGDNDEHLEHFMDETRKTLTAFSSGDLISMKSDMFAGTQSLFTKYYAKQMGLSENNQAVKDRVQEEYIKLFEGNQVIAEDLYHPGQKIMSHSVLDQLRSSEPGTYSGMKPKIREYLHLNDKA